MNLEDLCIAPDQLVWVLYCDLVCLNHDGALTDACVIAMISALKTGSFIVFVPVSIRFLIFFISVSLPEVVFDPVLDTKTVLEDNSKKITVHSTPVASTFAIFEK